MKVLLFGSEGQLGKEIQRTCPDDIILSAFNHKQLDICNKTAVDKCINRINPDCIINAAAYTSVDKAEQEENRAFNLNYLAVKNLAQLSKKERIHLVHISTDYVFNGQNFKPYTPEDIPCPDSVYGKSKLKGEQAITEILDTKALIIRTAWLYSSHGSNFVKKMLKLMKVKQNLKVIDEQIGTPTWAYGLANAIWICIEKKITGQFHWTDAGVASWYDFAVAILEEGISTGLLSQPIPIYPVSSNEFSTLAKRPFYSVLDKRSMWQTTGLYPVHWRIQLRSMLQELKEFSK